MGQWLSNHPAAGICLAVVILGGMAAMLLRGNAARSTGAQVYYYDAGTGRLFAAERSLVADVPAPSGRRGVRAAVFSCAECDDEADRFIGYLESYTDARRKAAREGDIEVLNSAVGVLIKAVESDQWHESDSPEAREILTTLNSRCTGKQRLRSCAP